MFRVNRPHILPIGVDIGHDSVKMLQLEVHDHSLIVHASARRMLDISGPVAGQRSPAELISPQASQAIGEMLRSGNFSGHSAAVTLPRNIVHVKNLRLPPMPAAELAPAVQFEARNAFPFETDEARVDFLAAGEVRQGAELRQEVVVLAAQHTDVDRFLEQLHRAGLVVDSLDVEPCALYRTLDRFVRRREDEQEVHVLIDIGARCTQVLIGKGRDISFFKAIEMGGADFNLAISRKLGISADEARAIRHRLSVDAALSPAPGASGEGKVEGSSLVPTTHSDSVRQAIIDATRGTMEALTQEISLCFRYHAVTFRGQRPQKVRVGGGEGGDPQLLAILHSLLGVPVESARPMFSLDCSVMRGFDRRLPSGEWSVALGLALKRTEESFAPLDGTPRAASQPAQSKAEVVDLHPVAAPAASVGEESPVAEDHFAAVRRAALEEAVHA